MDFGVGALIATATFYFLGDGVPEFAWLVGGMLALLPDFDIVPTIFGGHFVTFDHHQTLLHRPLLMIPFATFVALILGGVLWACIAFLCVFYHFLHDTGWNTKRTGTTWFWPFQDGFVAPHGIYTLQNPYSHHEWMNRYWFVPSKRSVSEIAIGATSLALAFSIADWYWPLSSVLVLGVLLMASLLWFPVARRW